MRQVAGESRSSTPRAARTSSSWHSTGARRSAAKNWKYVTVVTDHGDYSRVIEEMHANGGATTPALRLELARKVFERTSKYDGTIAGYLAEQKL